MSNATAASTQPIDHVAIAVEDADVAARTFAGVCGYAVTSDEVVQAKRVRLVYLSGALGVTRLQLVQPLGAGPVADFLAAQGEGLHHVCFRTTDIDRSLNEAGEASTDGIFTGGNGQPCAFLTSLPHGTRIEFTQPATVSTHPAAET